MAERSKALTCNPESSSSSPLPAGHAGVNSLLASIPASWVFNPHNLLCKSRTEKPLRGVVVRLKLLLFLFLSFMLLLLLLLLLSFCCSCCFCCCSCCCCCCFCCCCCCCCCCSCYCCCIAIIQSCVRQMNHLPYKALAVY